MIDRVAALTALRSAIADSALAELPALIGDLEALKAAAWVRISTPVSAATHSEPNAGQMNPRAAVAGQRRRASRNRGGVAR